MYTQNSIHFPLSQIHGSFLVKLLTKWKISFNKTDNKRNRQWGNNSHLSQWTPMVTNQVHYSTNNKVHA